MTLNDISKAIELELHNNQTLSESTRNNVSAVVDKYRIINGGKIPFLDILKLNGLDKALLGTLKDKLPQLLSPKLQNSVLTELAAKGQTLLPKNANIYFAHLLNNPEALKGDIMSVLNNIAAIKGGEISDMTIKILCAVTLMLIVVVVYCVIVHVNSNETKKEGFQAIISVDQNGLMDD